MVHGVRLDKSLTRDFPRLGDRGLPRSLASRLAPKLKQPCAHAIDDTQAPSATCERIKVTLKRARLSLAVSPAGRA